VFLGLNACVAAANVVAVTNQRLSAYARDLPLYALLGNGSMVAALDAAVGSTSGGGRGPFWLVVIPPLSFSGLDFPRGAAIALGVIADVALFVATEVSTHFHLTSSVLAHFVVVMPLFPMLASRMANVGTEIVATADRASLERDLVTDHVRRVSAA